MDEQVREADEPIEGTVVHGDGTETPEFAGGAVLEGDAAPPESTDLVKRVEAQMDKPARERDYKVAVELGHVLAASGFFRDARDPAKAAVKVMAGMELGLGPIASIIGVHIIDPESSSPKIMLGGQLLGALVGRHPRYSVNILDRTAERCELEFVIDGEAQAPTIEWTMDDAQRAGLQGKDNWKKYPRNMLYWRALSEGVDVHFPELTSGTPVYTEDELDHDEESGTGIATALAPPRKAPVPLDDDKAVAKMERARELSESIRELNEASLTPAQFNRMLAMNQHDHGRLDDLVAALEHMLATEEKIDTALAALESLDVNVFDRLRRENTSGHPSTERLKAVEEALETARKGANDGE